MTSEIKVDLKIEMSNLKYHGIHIFICILLLMAIYVASEAMVASK